MEAEAGTVHQPYLYDATDSQLQEFLLLSLFVAGKNAVVQQHKLNWFLERLREYIARDKDPDQVSWLQRIHRISDSDLEEHLRYCAAGQYTRLTTALSWLAHNVIEHGMDLRTCTRKDLCEVPGIGFKTASFFIIYTRRGMQYACLDTHILRWLREERGWEDCPKASPQAVTRYKYWEQIYLREAEALRRDPTELDFEIWLRYSITPK